MTPHSRRRHPTSSATELDGPRRSLVRKPDNFSVGPAGLRGGPGGSLRRHDRAPQLWGATSLLGIPIYLSAPAAKDLLKRTKQYLSVNPE